MKLPIYSLLLLTVFVCAFSINAQKRVTTAVVIDERLSLLRVRPSLFANSVQRMRRGRRVQIVGAAQNDGVQFFKVSAPPRLGWIQSEALVTKSRQGDEERLARLVNASERFEQVELATLFFELYPASKLRASMLLFFGDIVEQLAAKLSRDAKSRLTSRAIAASAAPVHSYYLNFSMLDRYRRLGVSFIFNSTTRTFHYNGASWNEVVRKYPASTEAVEAKKRLDGLRVTLNREAGGN